MKQTIKNLLKRIKMLILLNTKYTNITCGKNFYCGKNLTISKHIPKGEIKIGNNVFIGGNSHIAAKINIDDYCMLANYVVLVGGDHNFTTVGTPMIFTGRDELKTITLQKDVWVGHGSTIFHGITIGEGSIVGSGSIVTKDVPPYSIVAGNPATFIRYRFNNKEDCIKHSKSIEGSYAKNT